MSRLLAYDKQRLVELRGVLDAAVWHLAATRFDHVLCEEFRDRVRSIRPTLEDLRDGVLQPVIDCTALEAYLGTGLAMSPIVVDGVVLDAPDEIRGYLERHAAIDADVATAYGAIAATMLALTPSEAAAYWAGLSADERVALISSRPDLVARALAGGAQLDQHELDLLDSANAFATFTDEIAMNWELSADLRFARVELSGELAMVAMQMSDGTVQVVIVDGARIGVGAEADTESGGEAWASVGLFARATTVYVFPNERAAARARNDLTAEIAEEPSLGDQVSAVARRIPVIGSLPWVSQGTEVDELLDDLWDAHGVVRIDQVGAFGEVGATIENRIGQLDATANLEISYYTAEPGDAGTVERRAGMIIAGELGVHGEAITGAAGTAAAGFIVDVFTSGDGVDAVTYARVTVEGTLTGGPAAGLLDRAGVAATVASETGMTGRVELLVPLSDMTADDVVTIVSALAGADFTAASDALLANAEVVVSLDATTHIATENELGAGVVESSSELAITHSENVGTWHQYPGGELYSQNELDSTIDAARAEAHAAGLPVLDGYEPHEMLYDSAGQPIAIYDPNHVTLSDEPSDIVLLPDSGDQPDPAASPLTTLGVEGEQPLLACAAETSQLDAPWGHPESVLVESRTGTVLAYGYDDGRFRPRDLGAQIIFDRFGSPVAIVSDGVVSLLDVVPNG